MTTPEPHTTQASKEPRITKGARNVETLHRPFFTFRRARDAFRAFLASLNLGKSVVLIPDYVGWSPREGSGVADPLHELGLSYRFYRLGATLEIDRESLAEELARGDVRVVLLIHYFGYPATGYAEAVSLAHEAGSLVVEDQAHSALTDWVGGKTGSLGDASIYSLHKLLPLAEGGLLVVRPPLDQAIDPTAQASGIALPWAYDLRAIAARRTDHAAFLAERLGALEGRVQPLFPTAAPGVVPQTFPVRILHANRDKVYERMNAVGFGVVSLYHTLIQQIEASAHPLTHALSRQIMNLPVHQDADERALEELVGHLGALV
jgi:hypothetical protein